MDGLRKVFLSIVALAALVILPAASRAGSSGSQIDELRRQLEQIQRDSERKIRQLQQRIEELESKRPAQPLEVKEGWWDDVKVGYKKGAYVQTSDGRWKLKIGARLQFRFFVEDFDDERGENTKTSFQLRRARLVFSGHGFYPWLKYKIQLYGDKGSDVGVRDFLLDFAYYRQASFKVGQYKVPFNAEYLTSSSALQFVDRSIVNEEFALERDIGVMLHGKVLDNLVQYGVGIFNGGGKEIKENADDDFLFVGRVAVTPFGYFKYSQAHLEKHPEKMLLRIGAAVAGLPGFEPAKETTSDRKKLGEAVAAVGSAKANVFQFTADAAFKWMGFSAEAEYNLRNISPTESDLEDVTAQGFRVQAGYMIVPRRVEVAFRYAYVDLDTDGSDDTRQEFTPAVSYYVFGHRLKVQADYSALLEDNPDGEDFTDNRFRLQVQFYF